MPSKPKQKPSAVCGVYSKFLHLDMFAQAQSFEVEGERFYRTSIGSIMSILILIIIAPYVAKRYNVLVDYKDTRYSTSNRMNKFISNHNNPENGITWEEAQFKMAYGIYVIYKEEWEDENSSSNVAALKDDYIQADALIWKRYVDIGLKYRWYGWSN